MVAGENGRTVAVLEEVLAERVRQDERWGGPAHDDLHSEYDWVAFVARYLGRAATWPDEPLAFRAAMVKVAAVAVAAVEAHDRRRVAASESPESTS